MGYEVQVKFNRNEIAPDVMAKLDRHENAIRGIQSKAVYDIGEELQQAREELSGTPGNHVGGRFYAWCEDIGFKPDTVNNILRYHEFVAENFGSKTYLESLPKSLIYEVAKKKRLTSSNKACSMATSQV